MSSVNKVILVGNLGRDPEMRTFPNGDQVCNVTIATTERWKDKQSGENKEATEWHRLIFNGRLAEIAGEYLRKGSQIYVEGGLRTRKYTDQNGVEKYTTEIRVSELKMLGKRPEGDGQDDGDGYDEQPQRQQRQAPQQGRGGQQRSGYGNGGGQRTQGSQQRQAPARQARAPAPDGFSDMDDDIPF